VWYRGHLYITGRLKEMLIVNGTKHYPVDIEEAVAATVANGITVAMPTERKLAKGVVDAHTPQIAKRVVRLRPGGILACEVENRFNGKNELVILVEMSDAPPPPPSANGDGAGASSAGGNVGGSGKLSSGQLAVVNTIFKQCQVRFDSLRFAAGKCLCSAAPCAVFCLHCAFFICVLALADVIARSDHSHRRSSRRTLHQVAEGAQRRRSRFGDCRWQASPDAGSGRIHSA
jgi:hypothetical protein